MSEPYAWQAVGGTIWNHKTSEDDTPLYTKSQGDCGETCKRAKLCYACSKELGALTRGDILRCIETDELCTVEATSTTGKTLVKWAGNDFGTYTAEQIGELFWVEPKPQWQGLTKAEVNKLTKHVIAFKSEVVEFIRAAEAKLKEKNT
jgi:hypothetical protein